MYKSCLEWVNAFVNLILCLTLLAGLWPYLPLIISSKNIVRDCFGTVDETIVESQQVKTTLQSDTQLIDIKMIDLDWVVVPVQEFSSGPLSTTERLPFSSTMPVTKSPLESSASTMM